jgi:MscS family membrane protein
MRFASLTRLLGSFHRGCRLTLASLAGLATGLALLVSVTEAQEPPDLGALSVDTTQAETAEFKIRAVRTDSPRATLTTFIRLRAELETALLVYLQKKTSERARHIEFLLDQLISLMDLSAALQASEREVGIYTLAALLDIFGRIGLPNLDSVPNEDNFEDEGFAQYRIPGTPIRITRVDEGPREREFLINERVILVAPRFVRGIEHLPLRSHLGIKSWMAALPQLSGPLIPSSLVTAMPESMLRLWLDTPVWKVIAIALIALLATVFFALLHRWLSRIESDSRIGALAIRLVRPLSVMLLVVLLIPVVERQINTSGAVSTFIDSVTTALMLLSTAWLFWLSIRLFFEWIILSPRIPDESLDANLLRLVASSIGAVGVIGIVAYCGQELGLPILSVLAGLGIGGLAIALAIRPTLENLIGGFILYVDRPVRVGDYCTFGDQSGTIERIGIRSTQLRALDESLISIPNAQFADLQIVNRSNCDVVISRVIGFRYETDLDQLRYVLARMREMFHSHPKIDSDTARVRFEGYGTSSLDVSIRVFVKTREWSDYYAVQEDVFFRIGEIVKQSGAEFAFPSQTLYIGKDQAPDADLSEKAKSEVANWRRTGQLPFPGFSSSKLAQLDGRLKYPPRGSPDYNATEEELSHGGERLSAEEQDEESETPKSGAPTSEDPKRN